MPSPVVMDFHGDAGRPRASHTHRKTGQTTTVAIWVMNHGKLPKIVAAPNRPR
ncbi:hypothetical protein [Actinophytocola xanthii]|uniref:hypothetical protein n=1 Tax=Actinophytocola xanthii TaxID=1912961 RepID=UPI0013016CCF|nr:hypothetical protein [Actinophytocola xanthii]